MYNSVVLSAFTKLSNQHHCQNIFILPLKEILYPLNTHSHLLLPAQPLATTNLYSISMDLSILDISYKWNHIICVILCLNFSLNMMPSKFFFFFCNTYQYLIPFYGWLLFHCMAIPHLLIHLLMNIWVVSLFWLKITLCIFVCKFLFEYLLSILSCIYQEWNYWAI